MGSRSITFNNAERIVDFDDYDVLVELIGGDEGISKIVFDALKKAKMLLQQIKPWFRNIGRNLMRLLKKENQIKFEAAVAGGIPIIKVLSESNF